MSIRIDHNGKTFTDRVRKQRVQAVIQTASHRLRGIIFCDFDERLKDQLNADAEQFIAIADAEILAADDSVLHRADFLTLNKRHIIWILPDQSAGEGTSSTDANALSGMKMGMK